MKGVHIMKNSLYLVIKFLRDTLQQYSYCQELSDILAEKPLSSRNSIAQLEQTAHNEVSRLLCKKGICTKQFLRVDSEILSNYFLEQPLWIETFVLKEVESVVVLAAISIADTSAVIFIHMEEYAIYTDSKTHEECGETQKFIYEHSHACIKR